MSSKHRVIWSQGMFLQPHHFQQQTRYLEGLVDARVRGANPHAWGFAELVLDEGQLATGRVALLRASGLLPDGAPFSCPDIDSMPAPLEVPAEMQGELVCLAAPRERAGATEVDFGDGQADPLARFAVQEHELRDQTHAADDPEPVQLGALRLRLMRGRDATDAFAVLGVARVVERRADGQVVLDRNYIAPQTRIEASGQLSALATLLHGLVQQRARKLAASMGQLGQGVSEVADFLMLQLLNRSEPLLRQFSGAPSVHPQTLHFALAQLAGELATFSRQERHPPDYPLYRHDDLQATFAPVVQDLRDYLSAVLQRHAVQIPLTDRAHGVRTAVVNDAELLRTAGFVLAVRAQLPAEQVRQRFPMLSKLGPVERLKDLVNLNLPGVAMRSLPVAPRQLPYHAGSHYFDLDRQGELWKQIERTGNLALHVAGDFPGLELELWAIRQA
ncbi:MAG: type VI secretion system baseplate subunit TssK [Rubrivivax sp.]|nr:type VI secretion system baseplate subunit TssK [Rubrivivax sp.]